MNTNTHSATTLVKAADLATFRRNVLGVGGFITSSVFCHRGFYVTHTYPNAR